MVTKTADELRQFAESILLAIGADESGAKRVAEHMIDSNLCGVDTHGLFLLPRYVDWVRNGQMIPDAVPEVVQESPTSALVRGNWGLGHVGATYALDLAIQKATEHNVAVVGIVQLNHIGRLGEYSERAARKNMIAMICGGGYAKVEMGRIAVPYGGRERMLCTNPWTMGFPAGEESPMIMDYATTGSSQIKVVGARDKNQSVPLGWIVDKRGNPSTDPNDYFNGGGLAPFGGHKGYGLMMAAELMGNALTGADEFAEEGRGGPFLYSGTVMIVFKADLFRPYADYAACVDDTQRRVRAVPPAEGFKEVLIPGDMENRTREIRQRKGIPMEDSL